MSSKENEIKDRFHFLFGAHRLDCEHSQNYKNHYCKLDIHHEWIYSEVTMLSFNRSVKGSIFGDGDFQLSPIDDRSTFDCVYDSKLSMLHCGDLEPRKLLDEIIEVSGTELSDADLDVIDEMIDDWKRLKARVEGKSGIAGVRRRSRSMKERFYEEVGGE